jgi:hypothetical protein
LLGHGWSSDQVVSELARRFDKPVDDLVGPVHRFVGALVSEELIEQLRGESAPTPPIVAATANGRRPEDFVSPELQKFTDMQYFLALDPVHEVDASGWPHAAAQVPD